MADEDVQDQQTEDAPNGVKALRQAADEGAAAKRALAERDREIAFLKAGIDTDSAVGKMFAKAYDGDLSAEAVKAAATEVGALKPATPPPAQQQAPQHDSADLALDAARRGLAGQAQAPDPRTPEEHPWQTASKKIEAARQQGLDHPNALAQGITAIMDAARQGDSRVFVQPG